MPSAALVVRADAATIWRWLTVPELMNRWMHSIENLRTEDGASLCQDTILRFVARGREHTTRVTEFEPERALSLRSIQGPITADYRYLIDGTDDPCFVTLSIDCRATGPARLIAPLIRIAAWHTDKGQIQRLKSAVELASVC